MHELSFSTICGRLGQVRLPDCDLVVGIAEGGIVPASLVAQRLGVELHVVKINYRDLLNTPCRAEPMILSGLKIPVLTRTVLLIDDISVTGATLSTARSLLEDYSVTTMVMKGRADIVVFPEIKENDRWPWKVYD
jgi:hypoxanthine phosphoribosyltransferase